MTSRVQVNFLNNQKIIRFSGTINLSLIDDFYFSPKRKFFKKFFDNQTKIIIPVSRKGFYLIECQIDLIKKFLFIFRKRRHFEFNQIKKINKEYIKLNFDLSHLKKEKVSDNDILQIYEKIRTDLDKCFICHKQYKNWLDKFECKYCKKNFCSVHRLPEMHNCWGNLRSPSVKFREIYSKGRVSVIGK